MDAPQAIRVRVRRLARTAVGILGIGFRIALCASGATSLLAAVAAATKMTIPGVAGVVTRSANPGVPSASLDKVSLGYSSIKGGFPVTLTIDLTGLTYTDIRVALSSDDPGFPVPASVTIPAGSHSKNLNLPTNPVSVVKTITVTATAASVVRTTTIKITPTDALLAVGSNNPVLAGGLIGEGYVILNSPASAGGAVVALTSSNTAAATVPISVTIPADDQSASFDIVVPASPPDSTVTISARYMGETVTGTQDVLASVITAIGATPTSVEGGTPVTGTLILNPAPRLPIEVFLTSTEPDLVQVPFSVTASEPSTTFPIDTAPVAGPTNVEVQATFQNPEKTPVPSRGPAPRRVSIRLNSGVDDLHSPAATSPPRR